MSSLIPLARRRVTLTARGWALAVLSSGLTTVAVLLGAEVFAGMCATILLVICASLLSQWRGGNKKLISLTCQPQPVVAAERLTIRARFPLAGNQWNFAIKLNPELSTRPYATVRPGTFVCYPRRRGIFLLGEVRATKFDVFKIATRTHTWRPEQLITVFPRSLPLQLPPIIGAASVTGTRSAADATDDVTVRPYVVGDEMRRVHWPATARTGDVMVRSEEYRDSFQLTLVVDNRELATPECFEQVISAAASIGSSAIAQNVRVKLIYLSDHSAAPVVGSRYELLETLAELQTAPGAELRKTYQQFADQNTTVALLQAPETEFITALGSNTERAYGALLLPDARNRVVTSNSIRLAEAQDIDALAELWPEVLQGSK